MHRQLANGKRNFLGFFSSKTGRHVLLVFMFSQLFLQRKLETQALSNRQLLGQLPLDMSALLLATNAVHCSLLRTRKNSAGIEEIKSRRSFKGLE